jgi:hypothetical protein
MDIFSFLEGIEEILILREPGEHSYLYLRIIRHDENISLTRYEARLDLTRISLPCWDILEIWIIARHASCRGSNLTIGSMYTTRKLICRRYECIHIGRLELRERAVLEYESRDVIVFGYFFEHF